MGTNFYLHKDAPCPTCGHCKDEPLHIGKSSFGWCFSLHVMPELGINDLEDWIALWSAPGAHIKDEYGDSITAAQMLSRITERAGRHVENDLFDYDRNRAEPGPKGLVRHQIGPHCVKHGEGTWDCIKGEFS